MANNRVTYFDVEYTKAYLIDWKKKHNVPSMQWISRVIARRSERYLESCFDRGTIGVDDLSRICKNTGLDKDRALEVNPIENNGRAKRNKSKSETDSDQPTIVSELARLNQTLEEMYEFIKETWR